MFWMGLINVPALSVRNKRNKCIIAIAVTKMQIRTMPYGGDFAQLVGHLISGPSKALQLVVGHTVDPQEDNYVGYH